MEKLCNRDCPDVEFVCHIQKETEYDRGIKMMMISESMPHDKKDYFNSGMKPQFIMNTNYFFNNPGYSFSTYEDYLKNGIYLTTALKWGGIRKQAKLLDIKNRTTEYTENTE